MFHANFIHPTTASWPFDSSGMDMIGQCLNQHKNTSTSSPSLITSPNG
ncbi:hypothetical protein LIER_31901 [Lithospermum erythrorhizon]|uniref:Uncharacterized protein n=1 Tax=Lithospermum erythrorhizon TaxID=34254 RepID=A0AAV3RU66_LITER